MSKHFRGVALAAAALVFATTVPAYAASSFGNTACAGVRPGAWMEGPRGTVYTMGFLFKGTDTKGKSATYMTTVGNFVLPTFGTRTWPPRTGPQAYDGAGKPIGRFVYAKHTNTPEFSAFGVVQLDKNVKTNPQVCHFGGPTGIYTALEATPRTVEYYGNGFPLDAAARARTALAIGTSDPDTVFAEGLVSPIDTGDAGAPFLADGAALGFWDGGIGLGAGAGFVVARLGPKIAQAQKALKVKLTLLTARRL